MTHFKMGYDSKQLALKRNENGQEISFKMSTVYNNQKKSKSKHLWDFILTIPPQLQSKWQRSVNPPPHKKKPLKQILVTMWTQGNPQSLFLEFQTGLPILEISVENKTKQIYSMTSYSSPQKYARMTPNPTSHWLANPCSFSF